MISRSRATETNITDIDRKRASESLRILRGGHYGIEAVLARATERSIDARGRRAKARLTRWRNGHETTIIDFGSKGPVRGASGGRDD